MWLTTGKFQTVQALPEEWTAARTNPNAVWARDNYGEEVCSLLTTSTASTARKLEHEKAWHDMSFRSLDASLYCHYVTMYFCFHFLSLCHV